MWLFVHVFFICASYIFVVFFSCVCVCTYELSQNVCTNCLNKMIVLWVFGRLCDIFSVDLMKENELPNDKINRMRIKERENKKSSADVESADIKADKTILIWMCPLSNPKNKYYRLVMNIKSNTRRTLLEINGYQSLTLYMLSFSILCLIFIKFSGIRAG